MGISLVGVSNVNFIRNRGLDLIKRGGKEGGTKGGSKEEREG